MPVFDPITLSKVQELNLRAIVLSFPKMFERAVEDWAKFKVGVENKKFTNRERDEILNWYRGFPRLWETIRPNFDPAEKPVMSLTPADAELVEKADLFTKKLGGALQAVEDLGIAPIIIAGIAVAGIFGVAGAIWAIGYFQKQSNISNMIDQAVAGKLPANVLTAAIEKENESIFGDAFGSIKWIMIGGAAFMLWPHIQPAVKRLLKRVG